MSIQPFSQVIIGFGNNKGQTTTKLLSEQAQKINRVNIKSNFGANPKISIKPIPQINLTPFTQMIYKKRDQSILKQLLNTHTNINQQIDLKQTKKKAQQQYQQLAAQLQLLKSVNQKDDTQDIKKIINKTSCTQTDAKKYYKKYNTPQKAIQMLNTHSKLIDQVVVQFKCNKQYAKQFLEANNYDINVIK